MLETTPRASTLATPEMWTSGLPMLKTTCKDGTVVQTRLVPDVMDPYIVVTNIRHGDVAFKTYCRWGHLDGMGAPVIQTNAELVAFVHRATVRLVNRCPYLGDPKEWQPHITPTAENREFWDKGSVA